MCAGGYTAKPTYKLRNSKCFKPLHGSTAKIKITKSRIHNEVVKIFRSKIIDVSMDTLTIELTGNESKVSALIKLMEQYGIKEMVRTGVTALQRGDSNISED